MALTFSKRCMGAIITIAEVEDYEGKFTIILYAVDLINSKSALEKFDAKIT